METNHEAIEKALSAVARERMLTDLQNLTRDAEGLLNATAGDVSEQAKEARTRFAAALERAKTSCVRMQEQTVATAKAAVKKADVVIRGHPYESIGLALGVGVLLGLLIGRK